MGRFQLIGLLLAVKLLAVGCAAPSVQQTVLMPANEPLLANAKNITIAEFTSTPTGFVNKLNEFYMGVSVNNEPYFNVLATNFQIDNSRINLPENTQLVISGSFAISPRDSSSYKQDSSRCVRKNEDGECNFTEKYEITCEKWTQKGIYTMSAMSPEDFQVVYSKPYNATISGSVCPDPKKDGYEYAQNAKRQAYLNTLNGISNTILNNLRKDVAPYSVNVRLRFMDEDKSALKDNDSAYKNFESALELVKDRNMEAGCNQFNQTEAMYKESPAVYYNLGICKELKGDLEGAMGYYQSAQILTFESIGLIDQAVSRVQGMIDNSDTLSEQLNQ